MPFQQLKLHILRSVQPMEGIQEIDFRNSFSEVLNRETTQQEAIILLMVLAPHVVPGFYEDILKELYPDGCEFPEWGGTKDDDSRSMQPTGETIQFVLGGTNVQERVGVQHYFEEYHWFYEEQLLYIAPVKEGMPFMSGKIIMPPESLSLLIHGVIAKPRFGPDFPAKELTTLMEWEDLVLCQNTVDQLDQFRLWMKHHPALLHDLEMEKRVAPGYKALFYGPSGTGKTLTASLLGKEFGKPVYRIDLSQIVSKYIGETEKNLEKVFIRAENKNWILFFDEGDSLFGKRSNTNSAQDRFANQGVSYLLQRIENFNGVVILASNYKSNIDPAFIRRFNNIVAFTKPDGEERLKLWERSKPDALRVEKGIIPRIANRYELTGAQIVNAMTYSCLQALEHSSHILTAENLLKGVKIEYQKEEKMFINLE